MLIIPHYTILYDELGNAKMLGWIVSHDNDMLYETSISSVGIICLVCIRARTHQKEEKRDEVHLKAMQPWNSKLWIWPLNIIRLRRTNGFVCMRFAYLINTCMRQTDSKRGTRIFFMSLYFRIILCASIDFFFAIFPICLFRPKNVLTCSIMRVTARHTLTHVKLVTLSLRKNVQACRCPIDMRKMITLVWRCDDFTHTDYE